MKRDRNRPYIKSLVLAAMFMALGIVLPLLTGQIPQIGAMMLPMHIPVLLCGLICGWQYGAVVGFVCPLLRSALLSAPPMLAAIGMAFELCAYGAIVGFLYSRSKWKCLFALYRSLIAAMIAGRVAWGVARVVMLGVAQIPFSWEMFISGALLTAIPGIILQLLLIPAVMLALGRAGLVPFRKKAGEEETAPQER